MLHCTFLPFSLLLIQYRKCSLYKISFAQVLKPATRRKVRTIGGNYREILAQCLQSIPSFLGGKCSCSKCSDMGVMQDKDGDRALMLPVTEHVNNDSLVMYHPAGSNTTEDRDQSRTIVIILLMLWLLIFLIFGTCYPGKLSFLYWQSNW